MSVLIDNMNRLGFVHLIDNSVMAFILNVNKSYFLVVEGFLNRKTMKYEYDFYSNFYDYKNDMTKVLKLYCSKVSVTQMYFKVCIVLKVLIENHKIRGQGASMIYDEVSIIVKRYNLTDKKRRYV